ncbi:hypothetical protein LIER_23143 [Lithospermum erythrorhizon]|uniref:Uncharacterized protein n=1 Tax=Lithospermum erythrorhizon TaxID=34254 RepID=A0AAV3QZT1_LITER
MIDGEQKPAIRFIYEAKDLAKDTIKKSFLNNEGKCKDIFIIIDKSVVTDNVDDGLWGIDFGAEADESDHELRSNENPLSFEEFENDDY